MCTYSGHLALITNRKQYVVAFSASRAWESSIVQVTKDDQQTEKEEERKKKCWSLSEVELRLRQNKLGFQRASLFLDSRN